jgi:hypothetical protein
MKIGLDAAKCDGIPVYIHKNGGYRRKQLLIFVKVRVSFVDGESL